MKKVFTWLALCSLFSNYSYAQNDNGVMRLEEFKYPSKRSIIHIPEVNGLQVLKCDFHMHTVFSDGYVWPNIRVEEAWKEGLDVIAFTEHVEYTPHKDDVKVGTLRSYVLAKELAAQRNILLIKAAEITRDTPPGHFNALFLANDSNLVADRASALDAQSIDVAINQDAFVFWNHPGWQVNKIPESYEWIPFVEQLYQQKKLKGIEVVNGLGFHKKALDWALDRNLTVIGNTDIHNLIAHSYAIEQPGVHRTMTLVFAKDRSEAAVREALEKGNTVAWSSKYLFGKEEHLRDLFHASVSLTAAHHQKVDKNNTATQYYELKNNSDLYFELELKTGKGTKKVVLYPSSAQVLSAEAGQKQLTYEVVSTYVRSDKHLTVDFSL